MGRTILESCADVNDQERRALGVGTGGIAEKLATHRLVVRMLNVKPPSAEEDAAVRWVRIVEQFGFAAHDRLR
jgi:hypothetical protein